MKQPSQSAGPVLNEVVTTAARKESQKQVKQVEVTLDTLKRSYESIKKKFDNEKSKRKKLEKQLEQVKEHQAPVWRVPLKQILPRKRIHLCRLYTTTTKPIPSTSLRGRITSVLQGRADPFTTIAGTLMGEGAVVECPTISITEQTTK